MWYPISKPQIPAFSILPRIDSMCLAALWIQAVYGYNANQISAVLVMTKQRLGLLKKGLDGSKGLPCASTRVKLL